MRWKIGVALRADLDFEMLDRERAYRRGVG
jgi:hypothetical protein